MAGSGAAQGAGQGQDPAKHAAATVTDCLRLAHEGQIDALLEHMPDDVLDRCIALRKSARYARFGAISLTACSA